jgi:hypothetical protein
MLSMGIYKDIFTLIISNKIIDLANIYYQLKILVLVVSSLVKQVPDNVIDLGHLSWSCNFNISDAPYMDGRPLHVTSGGSGGILVIVWRKIFFMELCIHVRTWWLWLSSRLLKRAPNIQRTVKLNFEAKLPWKGEVYVTDS